MKQPPYVNFASLGDLRKNASPNETSATPDVRLVYLEQLWSITLRNGYSFRHRINCLRKDTSEITLDLWLRMES